MRSFDELLKESSAIHGHHCAGQILGVRMAMLGCREVGIDEPRGCKKLIVYAEMDRCATDAVQAVTGCSLGKRTLKFFDYGKMAVTFHNTDTGQAVRVLAKDDARKLVPLYVQDSRDSREAQKQAYRIMPEEALFAVRPATVALTPQDIPGYRGKRVKCAECGEGINFNREVEIGGRLLCIPCSQAEMHSNVHGNGANVPSPSVLLVVGFKKVGKTTLIEGLIPELSRRGYRVGTVKRHHSNLPVSVDSAGTDSWRHRQAGAAAVALVTPTGVALFRNSEGAVSLDDLVAGFGAVDLVLVEGFHEEPRAKIEVRSAQCDAPLCANDDHLLAVVSPVAHPAAVPTFPSGSIETIAEFIENKLLAKTPKIKV